MLSGGWEMLSWQWDVNIMGQIFSQNTSCLVLQLNGLLLIHVENVRPQQDHKVQCSWLRAILYSQGQKLFLQFPWILTVPYILYIFIYQKLWHCPRKLWGKFCVIFLSLLLAYCISIWVGILSPESTPGPSAHALYSFCTEIKLHWFWHARHYRSNHSGLYLLILEEPQSFIFNVVALKSWGNSPGWWIAL